MMCAKQKNGTPKENIIMKNMDVDSTDLSHKWDRSLLLISSLRDTDTLPQQVIPHLLCAG